MAFEFDASTAQAENTFDPTTATLEKKASAFERLKQGVSNTFNAGRIAATNSPDEIAGIIGEAEKTRLPASADAVRMQQEYAPYAKRASDAIGIVDNVTSYGSAAAKRLGQFISNPSEYIGMTAENIPNSVPGMAAGIAGAVAGSTLGPVGTVVGGVAGGTAGGYAVEQGSSMQEQILKEANARGINPQDKQALTGMIAEKYPEFLNSSRLKGVGTAGTDAALNVLTMGLAGASGRALTKGAIAVESSVKAGTMTAADAAKALATIEAKNIANNTLGATLKRGAAVTGAEMLGEGISEGVGQKLAYGQVDAGDVIDESLMGLGQGVAMAAGSKAINKLTGTKETSSVEQAIARARKSIPVEVPPPAPQPDQPAPPAGLLGNTPDPLISFPDGTVGRRSEVDAYVAGLPENEQPAARARLMGLAPQPVVPEPVAPSAQMGIDPAAGVISKVAAQAVDTGTVQEIQLNQAADEERMAYEQAMADLEQARADQDSVDKPITSGRLPRRKCRRKTSARCFSAIRRWPMVDDAMLERRTATS